MTSPFIKPAKEFTADEAGKAVDWIDRIKLKIDPEIYDELLLVASGHVDLLKDGRGAKEKVCSVCKKAFPVLRMSAKYCSDACRTRAARRRPSVTLTPGCTP